MKKYLFVVYLLSHFINFAHANPEHASALKERLSALSSFKATFNQTVKDEQGALVYEAVGSLAMTRPNKLRWETTSPDETTLIADGDSVWHIDYFVEQVTVLPQQQAIQNNPMVLLTSSDDKVWQQYTIEQVDENAFKVSPIDGGGQILALTVQFDEAGLNGLIMIDSQHQQSVFSFTHRQFNAVMPSEQFSLTVPDGFMLDDQRS